MERTVPDKQQYHHQQISKFSLDYIDKGSNTIICGRRDVGKSYLICSILQSRPDADIAIFSSRYVASSYKKYFKESVIFDHYDPKILRKLIEKQEKIGPNKELVIAFDDIAVNKDIWNDPYIKDIVRYGSSLGITSIFSIQFVGQLGEVFQRNMDYVFYFYDNIIDNQKLMFEKFAGIFAEFSDFKAVLDNCIAELFRCLVIDLKTPRKDPQQALFWFKSDKLQLLKKTESSSAAATAPSTTGPLTTRSMNSQESTTNSQHYKPKTSIWKFMLGES